MTPSSVFFIIIDLGSMEPIIRPWHFEVVA